MVVLIVFIRSLIMGNRQKKNKGYGQVAGEEERGGEYYWLASL